MFKKWLLFLTLFVTASCYYTPDNFLADVIVDAQGRFSMAYEGDLVRVMYVKDLNDGKITPANVQKEIDLIEKDLARDPAFSEITSRGQGRFYVKYKRTGQLGPGMMLSFIRRDSVIFKLTTTDEKKSPYYEVTFKGRYLTPDKQKQLLDLGIHLKGNFRFATDAEVLENNAMKITPNSSGFGGGTIYEWQIDDFKNPTPYLTFKLKNNEVY